jgi:hypothetical protein
MSINQMMLVMLAAMFGVLMAAAVLACQPRAMVSNPEAAMHDGR